VTPQRVRAIRHGLLIAGLVVLVTILVRTWLTASDVSAGEAYDARAYWEAARGDPYARPVLGAPVAYYYSPAFLQVFAPLLALSFPAFLAAWYLINGAALVAVARSWLPLALLTGFVALEVLRGNIETLMALAIVAGFRWPAAWAFILLTKVTPGVGLLYFVGRRDWRSLGIAIGATLAIAAVSFALAPDLWAAWIASLVANAGVSIDWAYFPVPLMIRLPIAAVLALVGGWFGWRWMVPIASTLAMPALWPVNLTLLVAIFPLLGRRDGKAIEPAGLPDPGPDASDRAADGTGRTTLETA
jgi:Glycosyltransferase family 87